MDGELAGQVAFVTGATGGLGPAVTRALLEGGAAVLVSYVAPAGRERLEEQLRAFAGRLGFVQLDVTDPHAVGRAVDGLVGERGKLDILAHLVGGYLGGKQVQETSLDEWRGMVDLNLTSAFVCCRAVLPAMQAHDYGRIIAVSSRSAVRFSPGVSAYTASKAAVLALIGSIAEENHASGITANAVLPSIIDTPANRQAMPKARHDLWPRPDEVAAVIRFLAGPHSGLISGAAIPVYGRA